MPLAGYRGRRRRYPDNAAILESLQSNLETDGYEVFLATRAAQALPLAAGQAPDLDCVAPLHRQPGAA